jgi:hypothetical protein
MHSIYRTGILILRLVSLGKYTRLSIDYMG